MKGYLSDKDVEQCVELLINEYKLSTRYLGSLYGEQKEVDNAVIESLGRYEISKETLCRMFVLREGINLFAGKEKFDLRNKILAQLPDYKIIKLYEKYPDNKRNINSIGYMRTSLANRKWYSGKNWAFDFINAAGFPEVYAGIPTEQTEIKPTIDEAKPKEKIPGLVEYQIEIKTKLLDILKNKTDKTRCMISLPTGSGKTRVAVEAFLDWMKEHFDENKYLVWIAQSEELCEQCISCVKQLWENREFILSLRIYRMFSKYGDDIHVDQLQGGVVVASINKLYYGINGDNSNIIDKILKNTGAMIIDEAHRSSTMMYDVLFDKAEALTGGRLFPICGLSATPGRNTLTGIEDTKKLVNRFEVNLIYPQFAEEESYRENPLKYFKDNKYLSKVNHYTYRSNIEYPLSQKEVDELSKNPTLEFSRSFLSEIANDINRNVMILKRLKRIPEGEPSLVYCCTVEHAKLIATLLRLHGRTASFIDSDTNSTERRSIIKAYKEEKIDFLCNYGVLTTGFDAPKTENIIICRPIFSDVLYEQIVGRGIRGTRFDGTEICNVIDFSDNISNLGDGKAFMRFKNYWDNETEEDS